MVTKFLSLRQTANQLGVSVVWLKTEAQAGRIPCLKAGRKLLFSLALVEKELLLRAEKKIAWRPHREALAYTGCTAG